MLISALPVVLLFFITAVPPLVAAVLGLVVFALVFMPVTLSVITIGS